MMLRFYYHRAIEPAIYLTCVELFLWTIDVNGGKKVQCKDYNDTA